VLTVREPPQNQKPILIDDENSRVDGFISVGIQTLVFPSEETKMLRKKENPQISAEELNYEIFVTKDSLRVGVKLLVAYKITDPRKAITELTKDGIVKHVENCCVVDMGRSIQACSSKDFLSAAQNVSQNKPLKGEVDEEKLAVVGMPGGPSLLQYFQDTVKRALASDLSEYGIELVRLNFETPKVLDKDIARQMADQALNVASVSSQEAVMKQKAEIARVQAEQEANVKRIAQEQENSNKLSIARTSKESAQLEADAVVIAAEAARKAAGMQGSQYGEHPSLLQIKLAEIQAGAIASAKISMVVAPEQLGNAMAMFGNMPQMMQMAQGMNMAPGMNMSQRR
jgi:regulator of protease activity HflC (stomatin/prohibitin superfamily)